MAFVARTRHGFEIRESRATPDGPRSSTLATFAVLDDDVLARAARRSSGRFDGAEVRRRARRLGAPIAPAAVDAALGRLIVELDGGARPSAALAALAAERLRPYRRVEPPDSAEDALSWLTATDEDRGRALRELLGLADRLPRPQRTRLAFPGGRALA